MLTNPQSAPRSHQRKILQACQQHTEHYVMALFKQVADKLDDVLFERGNQAGEEANAFMEAARELRVKRQDLLHGFVDKVMQNRQSRLDHPESGTAAADKKAAQGGGLSLVDEQDLEETLAVDGLVAKANDRCRNELYALARRFNQLVDGAQYQDDKQPQSPDVFAHPFRDIIQLLEWKVEIKLIAYKLFERAMLQGLMAFYQGLNALLSDAGVLPELKLSVAIRSMGGGGQSRAPQAGNDSAPPPAVDSSQIFPDGSVLTGAPRGMPNTEAGGASSVDVFQTLQQLMNTKKYGDATVSGGTASGIAGGMAGPGMVAGSAMPADDLVRGLSLLQHNPLPIDPGAVINVAVIKDALLEQMRQIGEGRGIDPSHDNTIDVIGMIFEFILDEPSIPDVVKNLLNRLQIPILKIAIIDKGFFTNKTHPARRLLNVLGHASIGWNDNSEEARQRRFNKMEDVVNRVLAEFEQDPGVFATLLEAFTAFLAAEGEALGTEAEAPARDEQAPAESFDKLAFETIEGYLEGAEVPEVLRDFLRQTWRDVLQHVLDAAGHESEAWRRQVQTVDDLMWSVEPKTTSEDRRKMVMLLPRLLDALRDGMGLIDCSQEEMDDVINAMEPIHMACLRGERPVVKADAPEGEVSSSDVADMIRSIQAGMTRAGGEMGDESDDFEHNLIDEDQALVFPQDDEDGAKKTIEDDYTATARDMELGTWLEFDLSEEKKRRGKLAWKSVVMGEYVFVDRKYKVVAERTLASLADDLRQGRAAPVENVAMFDRALDKVLNGLMSGG